MFSKYGLSKALDPFLFLKRKIESFREGEECELLCASTDSNLISVRKRANSLLPTRTSSLLE